MIRNEKGSVLAITILLLSAALVFGVAFKNRSTMEVIIAGNSVDAKQTFYGAEAATEMGRELLEQNIACPAIGFPPGPQDYSEDVVMYGDVEAGEGIKFWDKTFRKQRLDKCNIEEERSVHLLDSNTSVAFQYKLVQSRGSSVLQAEGYEGYGYGAAKGGAELQYDMYSLSRGAPSSESVVSVGYVHLVGQEEECHY